MGASLVTEDGTRWWTNGSICFNVLPESNKWDSPHLKYADAEMSFGVEYFIWNTVMFLRMKKPIVNLLMICSCLYEAVHIYAVQRWLSPLCLYLILAAHIRICWCTKYPLTSQPTEQPGHIPNLKMPNNQLRWFPAHLFYSVPYWTKSSNLLVRGRVKLKSRWRPTTKKNSWIR